MSNVTVSSFFLSKALQQAEIPLSKTQRLTHLEHLCFRCIVKKRDPNSRQALQGFAADFSFHMEHIMSLFPPSLLPSFVEAKVLLLSEFHWEFFFFFGQYRTLRK